MSKNVYNVNKNNDSVDIGDGDVNKTPKSVDELEKWRLSKQFLEVARNTETHIDPLTKDLVRFIDKLLTTQRKQAVAEFIASDQYHGYVEGARNELLDEIESKVKADTHLFANNSHVGRVRASLTRSLKEMRHEDVKT